MRVGLIRWDEDSVGHVARHGILPEEVEQVCFSRPLILRGRGKRKLRLHYVLGQTAQGRYLFVVIRYLGGEEARVVTARDVTTADRRRYRGARR